MPTIEEWEELLDRNYCAWSNVTLNGVVVRCVTSKVNGNKLYFPKPGCGIGIGIQPDKDGWYWSSSINKTESDGITILPYNSAYSFFMSGATSEWSSVDDVVSILERDRWGFVIRPVYDENLNNSVSE